MLVRSIRSFALLATGLLAGAFGYGAANLVPTFDRVPLQMRLDFHTELMQNNSISMQATMAAAALSCLVAAVLATGRHRIVAAVATALVVASFLITRLGNVPINHRINEWAVAGAPADYATILARWDAFHFLRTGTALAAFALIIALVVWMRSSDEGPAQAQVPAVASAGAER
ncbi:anthrone oxygenase family protein [Nocardia sp. NPDC060259]|uniref:anthrone oxygenase family protein n=1 Tax=Nocardia sp. NPDC060259 TaxID=3347088 RepID=UPI003646B842